MSRTVRARRRAGRNGRARTWRRARGDTKLRRRPLGVGLDAAHALGRAVPSFKLHAACAVCVGVFPEMGPYSRDSGLRVSFFDAETLILFQRRGGHFYFRFIKISHEDRISFLNPVSRLYRPQIFVTMRLSTALSM